MIYGVSITEENSPPGAADARALREFGIGKHRMALGKAEVEAFFLDPNTLRPGDIVAIPARNKLGERANTREARLKLCAERGALVQVIGAEPVLYDAPEKLAAFREASITDQRAEQARMNAAKGKVGRKPKIVLTDEQRDAVCALWWSDSRDGGIEARKLAARYAGLDDVPVHFIKRWCSPTRTKPTPETKEESR